METQNNDQKTQLEGLTEEFEGPPDHIGNRRDRHQLKAGDDPDKPDTEDDKPAEQEQETGPSSNDADGNGATATDELANPTELCS